MKELLINGGITFIFAVLQIFVQSIILNIAFNLELNLKSKLIYSIILGIYTTLFRFLAPDSLYAINPIIFVLLGALILFSFKKNSFIKDILYSIFLMIVAVPVEMISGTVAFQILKLSNSNENVIASIPVLIMIIICYMIIASLLYVFKKKRNINLQFNNRFIGINIALVFLMVGPNIIFYTLNKYNYPMWLLIYNVISNIVLVILAIYNTHKQIKLEKTEIDLKNSNAENAKLQNLNDNIRTFKHDYNNVVHAIGGYIRMNDIGGLEKYYLGLKKDVDKVNTLENITAEKINEPSVLALISTKCQEAYEKNISFNIESIFNYQNLDMPIYDFCKILGVLLDNAIEAAEETEEKEINIVVRQSNKTKIQLFSIENTYLLKDIDTEKIYEKDYSTKNRNSGIGLWEVRKIVERNDNVILNTDKDDKYFRQELYIQIREKPEKDKKQRETLTTS